MDICTLAPRERIDPFLDGQRDSIGEERRERRRAWWLARSLAIFSVEGFKRVSGHPRIDRRINPADRYKALWVEQQRDAAACERARRSLARSRFANTFSGRTKRRTNARYYTDPGMQGRIAHFPVSPRPRSRPRITPARIRAVY